MHPPVTRGNGYLETWLARLRAAQADRLIPPDARSGRLLDIGCGAFPLFLSQTRFAEKFGIDKQFLTGVPTTMPAGIQARGFDAHAGTPLPFDDGFFDVVTMLAVFEHIGRSEVIALLSQVHRVLRPKGVLILTTPSPLAAPVLKVLTWLGGVSREEIEEHKDTYSMAKIRSILSATPFAEGVRQGRVKLGTFEAGMNVWVRAEREP